MTNSFVRTNLNNFGIGKVIATYGDFTTVEYFVSVMRRQRYELARKDICCIEPLPRYTTCYFDDDDGYWDIGQVEARTAEGYRIRKGDETTCVVPQRHLFARCGLPSPDPTDALASYCFTHASLHDRRYEFLRYAFGARAATRGLTGLSSSRITLYAHQIEVTRRVLEDPVQRYLLADEVGLGKTIEAGIILRQFLLDYPQERALLVAPSFLLDQWRTELFTKFTLNDLGIQRVTRVSAEELTRTRLQERYGLLIVDEAHHVAAGAFRQDQLAERRYATLRRLAHYIPRVLLLSATPVLHHEPDFLAMLHLLDPTVYKLEELEAFKARVSSRQVIGKLLLLLRENTSPFIVRELLGDLDGLATSFATDARLAQLISSLRAAVTKEECTQGDLDAAIRPVRVHLGETYRLHRRLLRTRRDAMTGELLPVRVGCEAESDDSSATAAIEAYLEQWRQAACDLASRANPSVEQGLADVYHTMVQATESCQSLFEAAITSRLERRPSPVVAREMGSGAATTLVQVPAFEGEADLLRAMYETAANADRIGVLVAILQRPGTTTAKTVIFTSYHAAATAVAERLERVFGATTVARYLSDQSAEEIEKTVRHFRDCKDCRFLVCDRSGEEGRNLQFVDEIVHFDLPMAPNRVEQRIGRVDRIGRSDVLKVRAITGSVADHSPQGAWLRFLVEGFGVFSESIAGLQFLVDRTMPSLRRTLFREGAAGLLARLEEVRHDIAVEKQRNAEQSALDELEGPGFSGRDYISKLEEFDANAESIERALERWVCEGLGFQRESLNTGKHTARYRSGATTTLAADRLKELSPLLNTTGTYDRTVATTARTLRLFRPGEPFIDAMTRHAEWDDRGRAFAAWRWDEELAAEGTEWTGFRFTFVVEPDVSGADAVFSATGDRDTGGGQVLAHADRRAFARHADALFPAWMQTVYVDTDGRPEQDERLLARLRRPTQDGMTEGLRDFMLWNSLRWALDDLVDPGRWRIVCMSAKEAAERFLRQSDAFQARLQARYEEAEVELQRRVDQLRVRAAVEATRARGLTVTSRDLEHEQRLLDILLSGMRAPRLRVDSVGFLILSGRKPGRLHD